MSEYDDFQAAVDQVELGGAEATAGLTTIIELAFNGRTAVKGWAKKFMQTMNVNILEADDEIEGQASTVQG